MLSQLTEWLKTFSGVRARILVWYFLLTIGITLTSVWATYKIFCDQEASLAGDRLRRDATAFQILVDRQLPQASSDPAALVPLLQKFVSQRIKDPNEYFLLYINGQEQYLSRRELPPTLQPELLNDWAQARVLPSQDFLREGYIIRVVQPIALGGQPQAVLLGVYDATIRYQMAEKTLVLVMQMTLASLLVFSVLAWLTAGRALALLRQLMETARDISESDLSQRVETRGRDEMAALTQTFNQMLDRLQAAFTSQQDFIKDVSHELRTPITIIHGHLELLGDDPQERRETIALVQDELKRMNRFVNDLLLLMRAERPNFLRLNSVELASFTAEIFAKARGLAQRVWALEIQSEGEVRLDRQRITQVVLNLAQNAAQYTQAQNLITIGSNLTASEIRFWVRDDGEGIALEDQQRIFDRFARGTNSERRSEGGGLGLAIVQSLVKAHRGHLELFSRLGEGATFTIILPRRTAPAGNISRSNSIPPQYRSLPEETDMMQT
ncbi:MAG: HAMP domain-containing protein [Aphanocapsa sp. GSE-SYN-MK-11-07L]|jgi:signal transduction histidine kinase|nr:HAMP domain-containing protein [Aphanocapsa sp. GSE-SYN-MK-11-07L]